MDEKQRRRRRRELLERSRQRTGSVQRTTRGKTNRKKTDFFFFQFCMTMFVVVIVVSLSLVKTEKTGEMLSQLETTISAEIPISYLEDAGEKVASVFKREGSKISDLLGKREKKEPKTDAKNTEPILEYEADIPEENIDP